MKKNKKQEKEGEGTPLSYRPLKGSVLILGRYVFVKFSLLNIIEWRVGSLTMFLHDWLVLMNKFYF